MSEVKIKKAKIKDDLFLEVEYTEELEGHSKKDTKLTCTVPVHDDLKSAFSSLDMHMAIIFDELSPKELTKKIGDYKARGFSISGNDDNEGVTITGYKEGKYGTCNINTPTQKYETSEYSGINNLAEVIEECLHEVNEYLFNGKRAPERQLEMDFTEETENVEER